MESELIELIQYSGSWSSSLQTRRAISRRNISHTFNLKHNSCYFTRLQRCLFLANSLKHSTDVCLRTLSSEKDKREKDDLRVFCPKKPRFIGSLTSKAGP